MYGVTFLTNCVKYLYACFKRRLFFVFFRDCNTAYTPSGFSQKQNLIREKLPQLFKDEVLCAGTDVGGQGSCRGDSGGPLMRYDRKTGSWIQFATVQGSVGECGDIDTPGIYVRLDHSSVLSFIASTIGKASGNKIRYFCFL